MENSQNSSSFIPKSPVRGNVKPRRKVRKIYLFTYLTSIIFFGTLIASAGTFFYKYTTRATLDEQKALLAIEKKELDVDREIEEVRAFELHSVTAYTLLDRHVSLGEIFESLESTTLESVQLTGFSYTKNKDNSLQLSLIAKTNSFNAALFQRSQFLEGTILENAKVAEVLYTNAISEETLSSKTEVVLTIEKTLTPGEIPYIPALIEESSLPVLQEDVFVETVFIENDIQGELIESEGSNQ